MSFCLRSVLLCASLLLGCASAPERSPRVVVPSSVRADFDLERDVFAYPNQLFWEYDFDEQTGRQVGTARDEPVEFGQRCMTMSRGVRQFYRAARFDPNAPAVSEQELRELVRRVFATSPRDPMPDEKIVIPGHTDLRTLSREHEAMLKSETPGGWRSYVQRGNWRMFFAFLDRQQRATSQDLIDSLSRGDLPIVRMIRFPNITINHAVLIYAAEEDVHEIRFAAYDPNHIEGPLHFVFDRGSASFILPPRNYYSGGYVSVYQAYHGWLF